MIEFNIRPYKARKRLSSAELSRRTGIPYATVLKIYHGACRSVSLDYLDRLCEALDCSPSDVLIRQDTENR